MENEAVIETSIKEFVYQKIQEHVYLEVSESKTITVKHRFNDKSNDLGKFWLRVLRHQNNYPMSKYQYKEVYDKQGNNRVILKVDDVTLTIFLTTGTLMMQGTSVIEWFKEKFKDIMDAYDDGVSESENPAVAEELVRMTTDADAETNTVEGAQGGEAAGGSSDGYEWLR